VQLIRIKATELVVIKGIRPGIESRRKYRIINPSNIKMVITGLTIAIKTACLKY
jgi:hypothetical protein